MGTCTGLIDVCLPLLRRSRSADIEKIWGAAASSATTPAPRPGTDSAKMADPARPIARSTQTAGSMPSADWRRINMIARCASSTTGPSPTRTRSYRPTHLHRQARPSLPLHPRRPKCPRSRAPTRAATMVISAPTAGLVHSSSTRRCSQRRMRTTSRASSNSCATMGRIATTVVPVRTSPRSTLTGSH